jgi:hypothetical protein
MDVTRMRAGYYAAQVKGIPMPDGNSNMVKADAVDRFVIQHNREGWQVGTWRGNVLVTTQRTFGDAKAYLSEIEAANLATIRDYTCDVCQVFSGRIHTTPVDSGEIKRCDACESAVVAILEKPVKRPTVSQVADMAAKAWDAGLVEELPGHKTPGQIRYGYAGTWVGVDEYTRDMVTAGAEFLLWTLSDGDGGPFPVYAYSPDYADAFPEGNRAELESDIEGFLRYAWPYLAKDEISPLCAARDFIAVSHGIDSGFDRNPHGDALSELARTFGFDIEIELTSEDTGETVYYS